MTRSVFGIPECDKGKNFEISDKGNKHLSEIPIPMMYSRFTFRVTLQFLTSNKEYALFSESFTLYIFCAIYMNNYMYIQVVII